MLSYRSKESQLGEAQRLDSLQRSVPDPAVSCSNQVREHVSDNDKSRNRHSYGKCTHPNSQGHRLRVNYEAFGSKGRSHGLEHETYQHKYWQKALSNT